MQKLPHHSRIWATEFVDIKLVKGEMNHTDATVLLGKLLLITCGVPSLAPAAAPGNGWG